jgi:thiol:disulfide interchange protein DsbC
MKLTSRMCLVLWTSLTLAVAHAKEDPLTAVRGALTANGIAAASISAAPVQGLYEVVTASRDLLYVTSDGRYLIAGEIIDAQSHRRLTQERLAALQRVDFKKDLPHDLALKLGDQASQGKGRHILVVVDPNCPYCRDLDARLVQRKDLSVEILVTGLLGPRSRADAMSILCAPNPVAALQAHWKGNPVQAATCSAGQDRLAKTETWMQDHPVTVTPVTFFDDGRVVRGDPSDTQLNEYLQQKN